MRVAMALAVILVLLSAVCSQAQDCDEQVVFVTYDGTIEVHHQQALYNCCAWIDFRVEQQEFAIDIYEYERFEFGPCYCQCCFDLLVIVGGLEPGTYLVSIWKNDEYYGTWQVPVEGTGVPFVETAYDPCVNSTVAPQIDSWGMIKSLYRE
jgi:hypothetical protein